MNKKEELEELIKLLLLHFEANGFTFNKIISDIIDQIEKKVGR